MAFGTNSRAPRSTQSDDKDWKASAFINMYLPNAGGGKTKLHAIPLKDSDSNHKALIDLFEKDPEAAAKVVLGAMVVEYRRNERSAESAFKLG